MKQYLELLRLVCEKGVAKQDRTGIGASSLFGHQMRFDLNEGFPLVTTKKVFYKAIIHELLWFLSGSVNVRPLQESGVHIWDDWADEEGNLGPVYGRQWRSWRGPDGRVFDQLRAVIEEIRINPDSRRLVVSAWNVAELGEMKLPPCHALFQFHVAAGRLSCQLYQRSADVFLGVPFNIASYALLTMMVAQVCDLALGEFVHTIGDAHLYSNHRRQAELQLSRVPKKLPVMRLSPEIKDIDGFRYQDFCLENYSCHEPIRAPIAV